MNHNITHDKIVVIFPILPLDQIYIILKEAALPHGQRRISKYHLLHKSYLTPNDSFRLLSASSLLIVVQSLGISAGFAP